MGGGNGGKGAGKVGGGGKGGPRYTDWHCSLCGYLNHGYRESCRRCGETARPGLRRPKGAGRGGGGEGGGTSSLSSNGAVWGIGGIAQRQLQEEREARRREKEKNEKQRAEHKRAMERMQRQLEAARKGEEGPEELDLDDDDEDADDLGEDKQQKLAAELRHVEALSRSLDDGAPFKAVARKRAEEIKEELEAIKEKRGGPEAKVLGLAGRHARALRNARSKLVRKTKQQARLDGEVDEMESNIEELRKTLEEKKKELNEAKKEVQVAHDELQKLANSGEEDKDDKHKGTDEDDDNGDRPRGPQERCKALMDQLALYLPKPFKERLDKMVDEAREAAENAYMDGGGKGGGSGATQTVGTGPEASKEDDDPETEAMDDLEASTVELLDAVLGAAGGTNKDEEHGPVAGKGILRAIKRQGATPAKLRAVVKDLKAKGAKQAGKNRGGTCGTKPEEDSQLSTPTGSGSDGATNPEL